MLQHGTGCRTKSRSKRPNSLVLCMRYMLTMEVLHSMIAVLTPACLRKPIFGYASAWDRVQDQAIYAHNGGASQHDCGSYTCVFEEANFWLCFSMGQGAGPSPEVSAPIHWYYACDICSQWRCFTA